MLIEAVEKPLTYEWPDGRIRLEPGKPIHIADEHRALKVLAKCGERVRVIEVNWESEWRKLAEITNGVTRTDPRYRTVMDHLEHCDARFDRGDWVGFQQIAEDIGRLMKH